MLDTTIETIKQRGKVINDYTMGKGLFNRRHIIFEINNDTYHLSFHKNNAFLLGKLQKQGDFDEQIILSTNSIDKLYIIIRGL